jgi:hypothetical protein
LSLLAQYRFFFDRAAGMQLALLVGLKLPTGDTSVRAATGERFETEFQPGGGAWEGSLGLAFTKRFGALSLDANVLYVLATEGAQDTNLGDRLLYNLALSYRLTVASPGADAMYAGLPPPMYHGGPKAHHGHEHADEEAAPPKAPSLDLVLELNGEWHGRERIAGVADPNSGGTVVFLSPGLRLSYEQWSGFVSFGVPVFSDLNGVQAEPDWRVLTGISVHF